MKMPSVMGHKFSEVPKAEIQRSQFDRSSGHKTTLDAGFLVPFWVDEALPGDTFVVSANIVARMATPLKPLMDNMFMETFFFFVPNRLVWNNWERFQGAQDNPDDPTDYLVPIASSGSLAVQGLEDYMGLPIWSSGQFDYAQLHFRAYNLIWNEWFRDQNLQDSVVVDKDDGPDTPGDYVLLRRGKRHDYFTSCLPWPQKGDPVALPLTGNAPVIGIGKFGTLNFEDLDVSVRETASAGATTYPFAAKTNWEDADDQWYIRGSAASVGLPMIFADLSAVTAATINELRQAFQIQKILERDARGGTRYTEAVKARFGVTSPDARLQRPEYLGGGSSPVIISPIAQTSEDGSTPQGNLSAIGTVNMRQHGFAKSFTEHGVLLGLVSVRADLTYQQGTERMWSRRSRFDFFEPALAHLGEQAVLRKEIFTDGNPANDDLVFGYQERFAEYRYKPSRISGKFRSNDPTTLDVWHLSQEFGSAPELNAAFIVDDPPVDRVIATPTEPHFLVDSYVACKAARPMPLFGVPGFIDHF